MDFLATNFQLSSRRCACAIRARHCPQSVVAHTTCSCLIPGIPNTHSIASGSSLITTATSSSSSVAPNMSKIYWHLFLGMLQFILFMGASFLQTYLWTVSWITAIIDRETAGSYPEFLEYGRMHYHGSSMPGWVYVLAGIFPGPRREPETKAIARIMLGIEYNRGPILSLRHAHVLQPWLTTLG
ncbi:hypothetical protein B0H10DRAFT_1075210 [Mycena sp. CBHHK59/15]|nr:hypothetical protein B0H10DRAFT_1075210 [Mycena sp. CBHHK59/15]